MNEGTRNFRKTKTKARGTKLTSITHKKNKVHIKLRRNEQEAKAKPVALLGNSLMSARNGTPEKKVAVAMTQAGTKDTAIGNKAGPPPLTVSVVTTPTPTRAHILNKTGILTLPLAALIGLLQVRPPAELQNTETHKRIVAVKAAKNLLHHVPNRSLLMITFNNLLTPAPDFVLLTLLPLLRFDFLRFEMVRRSTQQIFFGLSSYSSYHLQPA